MKKYVIEGEIGRGTMGAVHKARLKRKKGSIALREVKLAESVPADRREEFAQRFETEAAAAAGLEHGGVVATTGTFEEDGNLYLAMELVEAPTLLQVLKEGPLPPDRAVPIMLQVIDALGAAHTAGIVHRALKPANVFLLPGDAAKVADLGLARTDSQAPITGTGAVPGAFGYMTPEQLKGEPVDARSDVFDAGALLYEILSGIPPFGQDAPTAVMYRVVNEEPQPLDTVRPGLPPHLSAIIAKAMQKDPANRYAAMAEMQHDLVTGTAPVAGAAPKKQGIPLKARVAALSAATQGMIKRLGPANVAVVLGVVVLVGAMAGFVMVRNAQARAEAKRELQAEAGRVADLRVRALTLASELDTVVAGFDAKCEFSLSQRAKWDRDWTRRQDQHAQAIAQVDAFNSSEIQKHNASMMSSTDWWGYTTTYYTYAARVRAYPPAPKPPARLQFSLGAEQSSLRDIQARAHQLSQDAALAQGAVKYLTVAVRRIGAIVSAVESESAAAVDAATRAVVADSERGRYASQTAVDSFQRGLTAGPIAELDKEIDLELGAYGLPSSLLKLPLSSQGESGSASTSQSAGVAKTK